MTFWVLVNTKARDTTITFKEIKDYALFRI